MENILYVAPYYENTGLGRSSRRYINALGADLKKNLCIRPVYFTSNIDVSNHNNVNFTEYEENQATKYDTFIQHGYPDMFVYNKQFGKNIGIVDIETMRLEHTGWIDRINLLDEIWVPSSFSKDSLLSSGAKTTIKIVPEPFPIQDYNKSLYSTLFPNISNIKDNSFVFYFIGNHTEKNNILGILAAFFSEFNAHDNVKLIIKTNIYGFNHNEAEQRLGYDIENVQKALRIDNSNSIAPQLLVGDISDADILRLHSSCDCYINAVKAESLSSGAIEAALFGNTVIVTSGTGTNDYIDRINGLVVESSIGSVWSTNYFMENTFTIHEKWMEPNMSSLRRSLRSAYEMNNETKTMQASKFNKDLFSYPYFYRNIL